MSDPGTAAPETDPHGTPTEPDGTPPENPSGAKTPPDPESNADTTSGGDPEQPA